VEGSGCTIITIVPPRTGSSALAKPLEIVDAANPRGKARAVRREILFKGGKSTKMSSSVLSGIKQLACHLCRRDNRAIP
jgi:hypothetical protein